MKEIVCFDKNLLRSPAFRTLGKWSMLVYLDFLRKRQMEKLKSKNKSPVWIIKNNGEIVYPYVEAENKGVGRREFRNAIDELMDKGFLDITHQGSGGRSGDMTKYLIDDRWKSYGTSSFRSAKNPRKKDARQGTGWSAFHAGKKKTSVTKLLPTEADSRDESVTPKSKHQIFSGNESVTRITRKDKSSHCNNDKKAAQEQLALWGDKIDTIL